MLLVMIYLLMLLWVVRLEYTASQRFWTWFSTSGKVGHTKPLERKTEACKARFGSFYN